MVSVIIPTLNEAAELGATVAAVQACAGVDEIVCVDGGSRDETVAVARATGAHVLISTRGRGLQLHRGAQAAAGDLLWFLHADTRPALGAAQQLRAASADARVVGGNFRLTFAGGSGGARLLNHLYPRLAWIGLRYGDSGLWVRRSAYVEAGGFRPLPIFEDLDLLRRLRRLGRLKTLPGPLVTSPRRFESRPFAPVFLRWVWLQLLYWGGCDPNRLGRMYYPHHHGAAPVTGKEGV